MGALAIAKGNTLAKALFEETTKKDYIKLGRHSPDLYKKELKPLSDASVYSITHGMIIGRFGPGVLSPSV